jgi:hypothetical protein
MIMHDLNTLADSWQDVVCYGSCCLLNCRPQKVEQCVQIPYEVFARHSAQYDHLRIVGSHCVNSLLSNKALCLSLRVVLYLVFFWVLHQMDGTIIKKKPNTCVYWATVPSLRQVHNLVNVHIVAVQ